jgi:membrane protein implicated in regulation of membrane protease activity
MSKLEKFIKWNKLHPSTFLVSLGILVISIIAGLVTLEWYCYLFGVLLFSLVQVLNYRAWLREDQSAPLE